MVFLINMKIVPDLEKLYWSLFTDEEKASEGWTDNQTRVSPPPALTDLSLFSNSYLRKRILQSSWLDTPVPTPIRQFQKSFKFIETILNHHGPPKITILRILEWALSFLICIFFVFSLCLPCISLYLLCIFFVFSLYLLCISLYLLCNFFVFFFVFFCIFFVLSFIF